MYGQKIVRNRRYTLNYRDGTLNDKITLSCGISSGSELCIRRQLKGCGAKTKIIRENNKMQIFSEPELRYHSKNGKELALNEIKCRIKCKIFSLLNHDNL